VPHRSPHLQLLGELGSLCRVTLSKRREKLCIFAAKKCKGFRGEVKEGDLFVFGAWRGGRVHGLDKAVNSLSLFGRAQLVMGHSSQWRLLESDIADGAAKALGLLHALQDVATGIHSRGGRVELQRVGHVCLELIKGGGQLRSVAKHVARACDVVWCIRVIRS
jgi:hypothetical protein